LTNYALERRNAPNSYIGNLVAPRVYVDKDTAKYVVFGEENLEDLPGGGVRARSGPAERVFSSYSKDSYQTEEHSAVHPIDDRDMENADDPIVPEKRGTNLVTDKLLLNTEIAIATLAFNVTTFAGYTAALAGADRWDNAGSDPTVQVKIAKDSIHTYGVVDPDQISLILGYAVWSALQVNAYLIAAAKYTDPTVLTRQRVAALLGVKEIIVGSGIKKVAGTKSAIWGKYALFAYINPNADLEDVNPLKTFIKKSGDLRIKKYYDDDISSTMIEGKIDYDHKATAASSGYLFSTAVL
jgi:hypothetical protein